MNVFAHAFTIGLSIAMPLGPISFLCINKTLLHGFRGTGLVGAGACLAHGVYAAITLLGLGGVSQHLLRHLVLAKCLGATLLVRMGIKELFPKQSSSLITTSGDTSPAPWTLALEVALLTLSNPMTILGFAALIAGSKLVIVSHVHAAQAILGICTGSFFWRVCLGCITHALKKSRHLDATLHYIRYVSAGALLLYAAMLCCDVARTLMAP